MEIAIDTGPELAGLHLGVVRARGVPAGPASPELDEAVKAALERRAAGNGPPGDRRQAIRDLLRTTGYRPAGRGKPSSEYLAGAADRGAFPRVSHIVDALNLVSLESGLPISLLDTDRIGGPGRLVVRVGRKGERYVFNPAGQVIELEGLLLVAREDGTPLGNPVKDSMAAKTTGATRNVLALVWASRRAIDREGLEAAAGRLGRLLGGEDIDTEVLAPPGDDAN